MISLFFGGIKKLIYSLLLVTIRIVFCLEKKLDKTDLELKYKSLSDYDLAMLFKSDGLTEDAKSVMNNELSKRQLTPNKMDKIIEIDTLEKDNITKKNYEIKDYIWGFLGIIAWLIFRYIFNQR